MTTRRVPLTELFRVILWAGPGIRTPATVGNALAVGLGDDGVSLAAVEEPVWFQRRETADVAAVVMRGRGYDAVVAAITHHGDHY